MSENRASRNETPGTTKTTVESGFPPLIRFEKTEQVANGGRKSGAIGHLQVYCALKNPRPSIFKFVNDFRFHGWGALTGLRPASVMEGILMRRDAGNNLFKGWLGCGKRMCARTDVGMVHSPYRNSKLFDCSVHHKGSVVTNRALNTIDSAQKQYCRVVTVSICATRLRCPNRVRRIDG